MIVGDGDGMVGVGYGKAKEVPAAIAKGVEEAKKHFFRVPRIQGTIPHPVQGEKAAGVVLLRPAAPGTGVIAGGPVRAVLECAGIHDVLSKSLGSSNQINIVHATVAALRSLEEPEAVAARRGLPVEDVAPAALLRAQTEVPEGVEPGGGLLMARLKVEQKKSTIGCKKNQRDTLRSLGLKRIGDVVVKEDRPEFRGMVHTVRHLVTVEEVDGRGDSDELKLHHLRPAPGARTAKTRVGRGEASKGKTAGRGTKGTKARYQVPAAFEGGQMPIHMRLPKLKGFKNPFKVEFQVVNLDRINELFPEGGDVTVADLVAKGAVRKGQPVKVLGQGELSVAVQVTARRVLRLRQGEDRGCRRHRDRALSSDHVGCRQGRMIPDGPRTSCPGRPRRSSCPVRPRTDSVRAPHAGLIDDPKEEHVLGAFANAFRTPDLRKKLLFVLFIVAVFRLGCQIPTPGVNVANVQACFDATKNSGVYGLINLFSGGALLQLTIFALGIMPYITASIILQLLVVVIPRLEALKKEGQSGQTKITQYTRYLTLALADPAGHRHRGAGPHRQPAPGLQQAAALRGHHLGRRC